jgi:hypothetical protein
MRHLSSEELLDIADGTGTDRNVHLTECDDCQAELRELRATLTDVRAVNVPEPSPLFWDHFSARVREAVESEGPVPTPWLSRWSWRPWRMLMPIAAVAVLALVAAITLVIPKRATENSATSPSGSVATTAANTTVDPADDPVPPPERSASFDVVADLTTDVDLDTVQEAGLLGEGTADHAVTHMNDDELRELARLLRDEIARVQPS